MSHIDLNAMLKFLDDEGKIRLDSDRQAAKRYFLDFVNQNTVFFHSLEEKLDYLVENDYYDVAVLDMYGYQDDITFIKDRFKQAYAYKHRFRTYMGAMKYYTSYTLRTNDGKRFLERFEDRVVMNALSLGNGDRQLAERIVDQIMSGRYQPATPTFLSAGRSRTGEAVSCFLVHVGDDLNSIGRSVNSALQLSKRGGGVALSLTDLREAGAPIKGIENAAKGPVPVMKILEDSFSYADQMGQRAGAGAVYVHACHPDILAVLDTKRENADEKVRIKTLSIGVVVPDVVVEALMKGEDYYTFSPYDIEKHYGKTLSFIDVTKNYRTLVDDGRIRKKKISARNFFARIAEIQCESGYPYLMFEDNVNHHNPIDGRVVMSNLCSEILQVTEPSVINDDQTYAHLGKDISCNLGSLNVANVMRGGDIAESVDVSIRALNTVATTSHLDAVPSIEHGNRTARAVGLGAMNLHGYLMSIGVQYGSPESLEFVRAYFSSVNYHSIRTSMQLAIETGVRFENFEKSAYATGEYFEQYLNDSCVPTDPKIAALFENDPVPTKEDWAVLMQEVQVNGLHNQYRLAVAPNGSISYINDATSSIHPITARIEERKEGKIGTVYYPAANLTNDNRQDYLTAYELGWKPLIDVYAEASKHVDQGLSLTLFFKAGTSTREINRAQVYAWKKGVRTIYYVRLAGDALEGTECESCKV